ncbi:PREDICTED: alpha-protein kinase 2 [Calidris pugnax]|uniref:alpha-protein kinase 2 n=1 Tax=Calidris pugnax TaxID=198806 RepID=UPI00071D446C|nr:PREDICTED: alpha-protein kinase 2 [Calidris pugnax]XP_014817139.1 PREDICTED: alpha-protein kinase 2 [Calidris pugnax]XP_014817140.1 PREDICTED: alpha-protein kinase 2 [Calidris pugnax]XP_014817141.1 PREDICTED: alpha-protein kinase 2 [Calidris pugnax]XP_014817142.1 PREDICTED: alpha-protein kinase 2 [Calidris pugnax]XP_014817143.1 PREDICTED: alpha-protein kinase 2 [Calidris pugnax]XP_014817144.1 PREDICTED: alpha-protein kinase 2 [Calidris pugnax]XP_014817145.1 PREDICTED: alpha-protein kinase
MEDNMDVKNVFKTWENISCLRDFSENGADVVNFQSLVGVSAGRAEQSCGDWVDSCPSDVIADHTDNCCLRTEESVSGQSLAEVQACKSTGLDRALNTNTVFSEQADTPLIHHSGFVKDDSENPATLLDSYAEKIPSVSDDFSDDDLEYFECSDVLTAHENEIWENKLRFLLESGDEDDLKLSKDCDGCAYFLGEMPCLFRVSDNTTPMDTTIGFCGHHSKLKGVNVRRDPSMYSQSTPQAEMTLTLGQHRDKSSSLKDKEKYEVPIASAATENDRHGTEEENNGSARSAAGFSADKSKNKDNVRAEVDSAAGGTGASVTDQASESVTETRTDKDLLDEGSLLLEEAGRNLPEESARHAVCTLTESLRRNLFKLLNPRELCRYVSNIGQSFQAAAEVRESSALCPRQEGVLSAPLPEETASLRMQTGLCHAEGADKDCHWERKRTSGLAEQDQLPNENVSLKNEGAALEIFPQNCERLCLEPEMEKDGICMTWENAGTIPPASEMLCTEQTLQAKNANLQSYSQNLTPCDTRESCHQQVFCEQGIKITSDGNKSENDVSPSPLWDTHSVPDKQESLCAVLSSARLCDEPGEAEQSYSCDSHNSNNTNLSRLSCEESLPQANPESVLESREPGCKGDADISAVHDKLWKLLHEDDSEYQIPFENRGITSLEMRPRGIEVTELNSVQESCSAHPWPVAVTEGQEPVTPPAGRQGAEGEDHGVPSTLLKADEACNTASLGNACLAQVVETDGVCLDPSTGNKTETPSICVSSNSNILNPGERLEQKPNPTLTDRAGSIQTAVAWEGKGAVNDASQTGDADSPQRFKHAQSRSLACDKENPIYLSDKSHGTVGQLLHTEHNVLLINESVPGKGYVFRDCYPAREELADFPEEKDIFPSENINQFPHEEHSSINTIHKSCEENFQEKGNHSDLNAQNYLNSDSYHLSKNNDCQVSQVVSNAQKCGHLIQWPDLSKTPETITDNLLQNTGQQTETEKQEVAFTPSWEDPFVRDFSVEELGYEPRQAGEEQRETCRGDAQGSGTSPDSEVTHVSESQPAVSPQNTSEQHVVFIDSTFKSGEELKPDSSEHHTCASGSVTPVHTPLPRKALSENHSAASEDCKDTSDHFDVQQWAVEEPLLFFTPEHQSEGLLTSTSAAGCPGTGSQVKTESTQTALKGDGNVSTLETLCKALQGQFHRVPEEDKEEAILCANKQEIQRATEYNPDETETKPPLHVLISSEAQRQMNISTEQSCPDFLSSSKLAEAGNSMKSTEYDKDEEVVTSESVVNGLVNLPAVGSGNKQYFQEQPPCSRTQPFSLALATHGPFPVSAERLRNQKGSESYQPSPTAAEPDPSKCKQGTAKSGLFAPGAKKKLPPAMLSKKPRLEEGGSARQDAHSGKTSVKSEVGVIHKEDRKEQRKVILKKDSKAPKLLKKIQAELFPDCSGNIKLCCQFGDIHGDSIITWTKDSKLLAQLQRSAQDDSPVSLAIAKASSKDQGMYYCCLNNVYGKVTAEFNLTSEVLEHLSSFQNWEGVEEIEFMQLMFREDFISDSYFGGNLHGIIATEELHFGEGMHRKAFRSKVMQGLVPVFGPGHPCVLKVHNAIMYGTNSQDDLVQKNYKLALQECYVQNTAREYAKIYAAEAEPLEGFGEVPEIIPIFLVHRPANNIPYATVEEELVGEFVKYSVRDGKEVNFLRRDSEAGQKCCTFQHWVYEKTNGSLLVTDLQGVGMKLTDVGIATLAKGYKGFKGNCSISFIEQFRALHQCNKYCEMLGLQSLRTTHQKQRKATPLKNKNLPNSSTLKKAVPKKGRDPRGFISSEH